MKNNTILFFFLFISISILNAQINKPKVSINTTKVNSGINLKGLKINNLNKFKTFQDFENLNIPVQQSTKELLNKKPTRTWTINPRKLNDGSLKLEVFRGMMRPTSWTYGGRMDEKLHKYLEKLNSGRDSKRGQTHVWSLQVKFRVTGGIEYRLKLKDLYPHETFENKYIYIYVTRTSRNGTYISRINMNESSEFNYIFKEPNSIDIKLAFTAIPELREKHPSSERANRNNWNWISISEVRIDRID